MNKLVLTNRAFVNSIEIVYDAIVEGEFVKKAIPVFLKNMDGTDTEIVIGKDIADSNVKQKHYFLNGVKVCTDAPDELGNHRHYQDLRVMRFTKDDGAEIDVTNLIDWTPDTCTEKIDDACVLKSAYHFNNPGDHHFLCSIKRCENHKDLNESEIRPRIKAENEGKNLAMKHLVEVAPELVLKDKEGNDLSGCADPAKVSFRFDKKRKLILDPHALTKNKNEVIAHLNAKLGLGAVGIK